MSSPRERILEKLEDESYWDEGMEEYVLSINDAIAIVKRELSDAEWQALGAENERLQDLLQDFVSQAISVVKLKAENAKLREAMTELEKFTGSFWPQNETVEIMCKLAREALEDSQ